MSNTETPFKPFSLGQIVTTRGAKDAVPMLYMLKCLSLHAQGDWGCICSEDAELNTLATHDGSRILSAYPIDPAKPAKGYGENVFWIITEADRSVTTFLL